MEADRIGRRRKWKSFKERLALIGCCASAWGLRASNQTIATINEEAAEEYGIYRERQDEAAAAARTVEEMNLASALAAERQHRAVSAAAEAESGGEQDQEAEAPLRVSLMRLLVEGDEKREEEGGCSGAGEGGEGGEGWCWCCVCMGRRKGAAFIPCGHTFCRVCSRELWLNRGTCPLCNRPIMDILDIF